ncbi:flavin reductase family protein [Streptomyces sp. FIT100]|uniref:flavin reductase family protein n=1 Tax=Streptomyces sp. FIT100 TaxID=2837956 RepID=UPI0021C7E77C|nr:flavin reductase family protein [Streptomyces sp. FIT100]
MPVPPQQFRDIFGSFPTSVSIITAMDNDGMPRGFTCNAICAVSADPPLLLISISKTSQTLPAVLSSRSFVVNFLASSGVEASNVFAGKGQDKFADVRWQPSDVASGAPILSDLALAYAECRVEQTVEAGDHLLVIARVDGGSTFPRDALLYCRGEYSRKAGLAAVS